MFGNVTTNNCILTLTIRDANGELLYSSGGLKPGNYISRISLLFNRPAGTYNCRAYVAAFDPQTFRQIGVQYSKLTVEIGG